MMIVMAFLHIDFEAQIILGYLWNFDQVGAVILTNARPKISE